MRKFLRAASLCKTCPLMDRKRVWSEIPDEGAKHSRIIILSEAPGEIEEIQGRPLVGRSGDLFNFILSQNEIRRDRLWISNSICCRPPKNDISNSEGESAKYACMSGLHKELEAAWNEGYRVILAQGNTAIDVLGIEGKVSKIRGSIYEGETLARNGFPPFRVIPTFHPAFIARETWHRGDGGRADATIIYASDIKKAYEVAQPGWKPQLENFNLEPSFYDVVNYVKKHTEKHSLIAVDIETTGLSRYHGDIVVIGLADSTESALVVPLCERHPGDRYWGEDEPKVRDLLNELFSKCDLIFQNAFFDVPFLQEKGFIVPFKSLKHDTLLLHSVIDPELQHDLGFIVSMYGSTPYWKDEFKNREGSIFSMDPIDMRRYNARDCVVLHQITPPMLKKAKALGVLSEYENTIIPLSESIMVMQKHGVKFDASRQSEFTRETKKTLEELEKELREKGKIVPELNLDSDDEVRWFLFGEEPSSFSKLNAVECVGVKILKSGKEKPYVKYIWDKTIGTLSREERESLSEFELHDIRSIVAIHSGKRNSNTDRYRALVRLNAVQQQRPIYVLASYRGDRTNGNKRSIGKDALLSYQIALSKRLNECEGMKNPPEEEINGILELSEWLTLWKNYTTTSKLLTSFTSYRASPDGRIHPNWNIHGTSTGRLSSNSPNLQQLPKRGTGSFVRRFFIAETGNCYVSADFENAEVALLGCETLDPIILGAYYNGQNIHDINTRTLFGIDSDDPNWSVARDAAKVFQFGGLSYGGSDREIFRKVSSKCPQLHLTYRDFVEAKARWTREHPCYTKWRDEIEKTVPHNRRLYSEFGRMREFLHNDKDIIKEAMNFRIQSAGASLLNRAFINIWKRIKEEHLDRDNGAFPVLQIHDQIVYECKEELSQRVGKIISEEMTRPFMYKGVERFLRIELEKGPNFQELEAFNIGETV